MGLGLPSSGGGGDRTPIIKYDGRAGRIFRIDRSNASGRWETEQVEITNGFQAIFDLENIETGWLNFPAGQAPDIRTVKIGQPLPPKPSDAHKAGFRVLIKLGKSVGGDVRELAANAGVSIQGMDALYDAYLAGVQDNPGKLPVVVLEKTIAVTTTGQGQSSTNYRPVWAIKSWADRPPELIGGQPANEPKAEPVQQMKTTSQTAAEPAPAESGEEF